MTSQGQPDGNKIAFYTSILSKSFKVQTVLVNPASIAGVQRKVL
jgi:hypothetical protein